MSTFSWQLLTDHWQLTTDNWQLTTNNSQLTTINYQLSTVNCQLKPVKNYLENTKTLLRSVILISYFWPLLNFKRFVWWLFGSFEIQIGFSVMNWKSKCVVQSIIIMHFSLKVKKKKKRFPPESSSSPSGPTTSSSKFCPVDKLLLSRRTLSSWPNNAILERRFS